MPATVRKIAAILLYAWGLAVLAEAGDIAFAGAVIVPTCRWPSIQPVAHEPVRMDAARCDAMGLGRPTVMSRPLSGSDAHDALLGYFLSYGARGTEAPRMITVTYP